MFSERAVGTHAVSGRRHFGGSCVRNMFQNKGPHLVINSTFLFFFFDLVELYSWDTVQDKRNALKYSWLQK